MSGEERVSRYRKFTEAIKVDLEKGIHVNVERKIIMTSIYQWGEAVTSLIELENLLDAALDAFDSTQIDEVLATKLVQ